MFENEADLRKLVSRLEIDARPNPIHCAALRRQMLAVFEQTRRAQRPHILSADTWRTINDSKITKVAAAAVLIFAALIALKLLIDSQEPAVTPLQEQLARIQAMYEARDVNSLMAVIGQTHYDFRFDPQIEFDAQVLAAKYLGQIGDVRALPALERLYLSAEENPPPGYTENPFAEPIEKIKSRIEPEPEKTGPKPDANAASTVDVNEVSEPDVNEVPAIDAPTKAEGVLQLLVVHKDTNEPLADVKLSIEIQREGPDDKREQLTDANGQRTIEIVDLATNHVRISATKEHFVPLIARFRKDEDQAHLSIPASYTLALEPGTSIGGFVQNEQGEPIGEVTIYQEVLSKREDRVSYVLISDHQVRTDANGFWLCDIMPARIDHIRIRLTHPDYIDDESYNTRSAPPIGELRDMSVVMVMKRGVNVVGRVVDPSGQPIEKASVRQGQENTWGIKYPRTETDIEGRFEFKGTRPGRVLLTAQTNGYAPDIREIVVRDAMQPLEFRLGPPQTIRGRVVDSNDTPIENVEVSLRSWHGRKTVEWGTKTDAEGYFEWNQAPKDQTLFTFAREGYSEIEFLELWPDADEHVIVMYRPLRVSGKVIDADSNEPVGQFKLILGTNSNGQKTGRVDWDRRSTRTFTKGRYQVDLTYYHGFLDFYVILIEADGYLPGVSGKLRRDQEDVVIDFRLEKGQGPSGTVYLANGVPAAGAKVALATISHPVFIRNGQVKDDKRWQSVTTGTDGRFSFPPQIERYVAVAVHDGGYAEVTQEQLAADANIVIRSWARIEGELRIGGIALVAESLNIDHHTDYQPDVPRVGVGYNSARTDADGRFAWDRIVPGTVQISHFFKLRGVMVTRTRQEVIEISPGQTVNVTLGGSGKTVLGQLFASPDPNKPVDWTSAQISLDLKLPEPPYPNDFNEMTPRERRIWESKWKRTEQGRLHKKMEWHRGRSYRGIIEPNGVFRVEDVPAGTYLLRISVGKKATGGSWSSGPRRFRSKAGYGGALEREIEVACLITGARSSC
jgi:protocatechuate 3,4-dioxygenase beta subunit